MKPILIMILFIFQFGGFDANAVEDGVAGKDTWPDISIYHLDGQWLNEDNERVQLGDLAGKPVISAMVYTSCQYSCPMITSKVMAIKKKLPIKIQDKIIYALISFDSENDTPEVLKAYKNKMKLDDNWVLLTGDKSTVRNLAGVLGVNYKKMEDGGYSHSNIISLWNRSGVLSSSIDQLNSDEKKLFDKVEELLK